MSGGEDDGGSPKGGLGGAPGEAAGSPTGQSPSGTEAMGGAGSGSMPPAGQAAAGTDAITPDSDPEKLGGAAGVRDRDSGDAGEG